MLDGELEVVQAASLHPPEEVKFVSHIRQRLRIHVHLLIRDRKPGHLIGPVLEELGNDGEHDLVGDKTDDDTNGNGDEAKDNGDGPKGTTLAIFRDFEGVTTNEDDQDLATTHNGTNADEKPVLCQTLKDVELIVKATVATYIVSMTSQSCNEQELLTSTG